jgi:methionyl-tRNA formyltransferase
VTELRIVFAGTPEFALPALRALADSHHTVVGALTQPDRPSGRGQKLAASPIKQAAVELGVRVSQPLTLKTEEERSELSGWKPDVMVVVAYGLILPREVLALPRLGCINIHASLLPRWRGAAPIQRAILAGDTETGITIMQMDAGLDTGPMLLQRRLTIAAAETSGSLHARLAPMGADAMLEALEGLAEGAIHPRPQPTSGVTYAAKISKSEALIDWRQSAFEIERKIRAFHPTPVAETRFSGEPLKIHSAYVAEDVLGNKAAESGSKDFVPPDIESQAIQSGSILGVYDGAMLVDCGRGRLAITTVQRPGRRPVPARDFAHSHPISGHRFG